MTDLGMNNSGPRESDNRDKSLHGLMDALAMAGIIAGSVILFAYASSYGSVVSNGTADTANEVELRPEPNPVVVEKVVDELMYDEKIKYINSTAEVEKPVYVNMTTEVEKEVPMYTEREAEENVYMNETTDEPTSSTPRQSDEQEEKDDDLLDESELDDIIPKRLLRLLDEVVDFDDDEKHKDDENKGND